MAHSTIIVKVNILAGNLPDGNAGNLKMAAEFAEFVQDIWIDDLGVYEKCGHYIQVPATVRNVAGHNGDVAVVEVIPNFRYPNTESWEYANYVKANLTNISAIWAVFPMPGASKKAIRAALKDYVSQKGFKLKQCNR